MRFYAQLLCLVNMVKRAIRYVAHDNAATLRICVGVNNELVCVWALFVHIQRLRCRNAYAFSLANGVVDKPLMRTKPLAFAVHNSARRK